MLKVSQPVERFEKETAPGQFLTRTRQTAAELMTGQPHGTYTQATTGNKVVDIADLVVQSYGSVGIASSYGTEMIKLTIPSIEHLQKYPKSGETCTESITGYSRRCYIRAAQGRKGGDIGDVAKSAAEMVIFWCIGSRLALYCGLKKVAICGIRLRANWQAGRLSR